MEINLRPYQLALKNKAREAFKNNKRVILLAPCGSGKTVIASSIMQDAIKKGNKVWFIVHRSELMKQANDTLERYGIPKKNLEVYMVQSLAHKLDKIKEEPNLIIVDECQHSSSSTYRKIINQYPNAYILGLSATPTRLTGKPLGDIYETIISEVTAKQLIEMKYLADYSYYAPELNIDFNNIKIKAGDYDTEDVNRVMSKAKIYGDIIKTYKKLANNKKTILYCASIEYSKKMEKLFSENGYKIKHFDGTTPEKERQQIVEDFRNNKIQMLTNVDLIGEGFDVPDCECVLLLRPTQSLNLFIQSSTRCLRKNGDKKAIIIDYVNNIQKHGLPTMDRQWSLDKKVKEYDNENDDGTLRIRVCKECFSTFEGGDVCPYCGAEYELTAIEIENIKEVQLKKVEEEKELKRQQYLSSVADKVQYYESVEQCTTWAELTEFAKMKNYKPGFAYVMAKRMGIFVPRRK